jgi:phage/plasmid-associated DNA primase
VISELLKRALGDYFHEIPHNCITKKSEKKDAPNPDMAKAKGKRLVQTQEPEADDILQIGVIKEYTGGGVISARELNRNPVNFKPQFGLFLQCNGVPKLSKLDGAISERLRIVPFPFVFVDTPTEAHHRPRNVDLKPMIEKSDEWRAEFVNMLLEIYPTIKTDLPPSPRVREETSAYLGENDVLKEWLPAHYEKGMDPIDKRFWVPATEILMLFKETNPEVKGMTAAKLKTLMELNGVTQERKSNTFKTQQLIGATWEPVTRPAGSYYLGLRHIEAHDE